MGEEFGGFQGVRAPDFTTFTQRAPIRLPECPLFSTQGPSFRHRKLADTILKGPKSVSQSGPPPSPNNGPAFLCPFYEDTPQSVSVNKLSFISGTSLIIFLNAVSGFLVPILLLAGVLFSYLGWFISLAPLSSVYILEL